MAANDPSSSPPIQPQITPEAFFKDKVAPQFSRRIDDLRRQILNLEQQIQERIAAQATVRVIIEGENGGTWYLNVNKGEMSVTAEPAFSPVMTVYQPRAYFAWAASMATEAGLFGPSARGTQGELTKSRIERLKLLKGLVQFTFTHLPDGGEQSFCIQLGDGERPAAAQTVLSMKAEDAQKMARGEINPQMAFMGGIIKVTGDMALAMQFGAAMV
ncbi:MAG: SCP2 sterol-binding domain-containing protein [Deltaproteobacteria bacterium]|nr:SCP2 sterol-binding domain-containing protein [Deltaproteobacteria bacterium]